MADCNDYQPWIDYKGYAYEMKVDLVLAADITKVIHAGLIQYVPGFDTPEAACRSLRGSLRRITSSATERRPVRWGKIRCMALWPYESAPSAKSRTRNMTTTRGT